MQLKRVVLALALMLFAALPLGASAQDYPIKPIKIIVPFPPGGTADLMARLVSERLSARLGQSIVVDNRGGAGGNIGAEIAAKSPPDGYTLLLGNASVLTINPHLFSSVPFDSFKDFSPIYIFAEVPLVLMVTADSKFQSFDHLVKTLSSEPGKWNYASGGNGSTTHLSMELLKTQMGLEVTHVPYKGSGPAIPAVVSGRVPMMFELLPTAAPLIAGKKVRALAVTSKQRSDSFPDVPTVAEAAKLDYEVTSWFGIVGPANMPPEVSARLAKEIALVAAEPAFGERLKSLGALPVKDGPDGVAKRMRRDSDKWSSLIKKANVTVD